VDDLPISANDYLKCKQNKFYLNDNYISRDAVCYFDDGPYLNSAVIYQPDVYRMAQFLYERTGADAVGDIGCGSAKKLMAMNVGRKIGVDFGTNIELCRKAHPGSNWVVADLERTACLPEVEDLIPNAIVICSDVVEHLLDPTNLLKLLTDLAGRAKAVIISTPDRDSVRGVDDMGPPANPSHVREWALEEFRSLLLSHGLIPTVIGLTVDCNISLRKSTIIVVADQSRAITTARAPTAFRPLAIVVGSGMGHLAAEARMSAAGFDVARIESAVSVAATPLPAYPSANAPTELVTSIQGVARQHPGRWLLLLDDNEVIETPWDGVSPREAIAFADESGYDAVAFTDLVIHDARIDNAFWPSGPFSFGTMAARGGVVRAWRQPADTAAATPRLFPYNLFLFRRSLIEGKPADAGDLSLIGDNRLNILNPALLRRDYVVELVSGLGADYDRIIPLLRSVEQRNDATIKEIRSELANQYDNVGRLEAQLEHRQQQLDRLTRHSASVEASYAVLTTLTEALQATVSQKSSRLAEFERLLFWRAQRKLRRLGGRVARRLKKRPINAPEIAAAPPLFDVQWYLATYPDVAQNGSDPASHYSMFGEKEGRRPNRYFDPAWYLATYPDVARSDQSPLAHYQRFGWREFRNPGPEFDSQYYLELHKDVRDAGVEPLTHYLEYGEREGRAFLRPKKKSRLGESGQNDKWLFCLTASMIGAHQERL
jgi:2-polyprenyl-3-methyl-5-hydroxy-6-metoxy-1,4-benzoquinol methylase